MLDSLLADVGVAPIFAQYWNQQPLQLKQQRLIDRPITIAEMMRHAEQGRATLDHVWCWRDGHSTCRKSWPKCRCGRCTSPSATSITASRPGP